MTKLTYSDDHLQQYLAGALPDAEAAELEARVATYPGLQDRLIALEPFAAMAREAFGGIPSEDRLAGLLPPARPPKRWPAGVALAAGLAGLVGFGLGTFSNPEEDLSWRERIAIYQALYVPATIAALDPVEEELSLQFANSSQVLGREVAPQNVQGLENFSLKRAQILEADSLPIMQIVLANVDGEPLAFCIVHLGDDAQPSGIEFEHLAGVPTAHWVEDQYGYMLVGRVDADVMTAAAQELRAKF